MPVPTDTIRVLHVDDDPKFTELVASFLERHSDKFEVHTATSPETGTDLLTNNDIDCVVSDYEMPGTNGIEFLDLVQADRPEIPFILFTGKGSEEVASEAISAGVTDYLQKETGTEQYELLAKRITTAVSRRYAESDYEEIFEKANDGIVLHDPDTGEILDVNRQRCEMLGYTRDELIGQPVSMFSIDEAPYTNEKARRRIQEALDGDPQVFEWIDETKDGERRPVEVHLKRTTIGGQERVMTLVRDITERKERERTLRQYEVLVETVADPMYWLDEEGHFQMVNDAMVDYLDADRETVIGKHVSRYMAEGDFERGTELIQEMLAAANRESGTLEFTAVTETGEHIQAELNLALMTGDDGQYQGSVGVVRDITERKRQERKRDRIIDRVTDAILEVDADGRFTAVSQEVEELTELDEETLLGRELWDVFADGRGSRFEAAYDRVMETREPTSVLEKSPRVDGWFEAELYPNDDGGLSAYVRDVTDRQERRQELEQYETLVEVSGDPMVMLDPDGHFTYVNEALVDISGYSEDELVGSHVGLVTPDAHVERAEAVIRSLLSAGDRRGTFEIELVTADGRRIPTENHIALLFDDEEFAGTVGVLRDITDRLDRERRLQRERDRLDEFAGVVSHDLRNPLTVAQGRVELERAEDDSENLEAAARALVRMEQLIDDVLSLARAGEIVGETESVELTTIVDACWHTVNTQSAHLDVETATTVRADRSRLKQLLENLLRNAVEHGGDDVTITVGELPDGFYVEDDGPGIPADDRDKIRQPGYSTSDDGSGFGLSIVWDVAHAHGWDVSVTEGADGGARFEITGVETV